ncbi:SERTA domain-containing protein 2-like [Trematomus bernacchii]|uniref:SERTA domain-containing protein 2-like n=1 Tax=Trematomus bernacchii TaxID=40690 RepID=UPI00146C91D2|nr:SERTA domain-containing protein 2-like [Trematomus bernacchii]
MLGNGVKRKLDDDEDVLEEERRPPSGGVVFQTFSARQTLLNMSLMKLYGPRPADLRLQRRVLINNVIQRIHRDFRQEGGGVGALFFSSSSTVSEDESFHQPPSSSPSSSSSSFSILSSSMSGLLTDSCLTPASLLEEDLPMFFTLPPSSSSSSSSSQHLLLSPRMPPSPSPSPKDSFSSALEEIEELCPSSSESPSPPPAQVLFDVIMKEEEVESKPPALPPLPPLLPLPPPPSQSHSFLTDFTLDDVLFTDIDTSMYDLGPSGAPPSKMAPMVTADDLVRSMSGFGATGGQNQPFKMDLAELDHIMEVLVGS